MSTEEKDYALDAYCSVPDSLAFGVQLQYRREFNSLTPGRGPGCFGD
jgi:hypothetical protein